MSLTKSERIESESHEIAARVLNEELLSLLTRLHERFSGARADLLQARALRAKRVRAGEPIAPPAETAQIRQAEWTAARGSEARPVIEDFEDGLAPSWNRILEVAERAVRGKGWTRVRGIHLEERHCRAGGKPICAAFFDLSVLAFAPDPGIVIPKLESSAEARLWADAIHFLEDERRLSRGTIRVALEVESLEAVAQAEEILFELKEHVAWMRFDSKDYASNWLKTHSGSADFLAPDLTRAEIRERWLSPVAHYLALVCEKRGLGFHADVPSLSPEPKLVPETLPFQKPSVARVRELLAFAQDFLDHWIRGEGRLETPSGACDLSDFELARCQLWQWVKYRVDLAEASQPLTQERYLEWREEELQKLKRGTNPDITRLYEASRAMDALILNATIAEFSIPVAQAYLKSA